MLNYMEYLNIPAQIAIVVVVMFFIIQVVGELLEFKGKIVPEFLKIRKYFKRKKEERKIISQVPETLARVEKLLNEVNQHYDKDNIAKRDAWMKWVNDRAMVYDAGIEDLEKKMDKNNEITLSLSIESKRNAIINFASKVVDEKYLVTKEQFNRIFKIHKEYEKIIEDNKLENGEVDIAIRIIEEEYENHMRNHTFVENLRGYN